MTIFVKYFPSKLNSSENAHFNTLHDSCKTYLILFKIMFGFFSFKPKLKGFIFQIKKKKSFMVVWLSAGIFTENKGNPFKQNKSLSGVILPCGCTSSYWYTTECCEGIPHRTCLLNNDKRIVFWFG